ncbi:hypothetical protein GGF46_001166 [Coemansia sp. RSA 552]|nr:hypothetical protein GGF46_001166 [Coemansia sp. RSA 552]
MQFTKCFVAIAALASAVVAVDWAAPEAVKCAQDNWPAIKQQGDSMMGLAKSLLGDDYAKLQELFGTAEGEDLVLPETITDEQLKQMSEILDPQIMDMPEPEPPVSQPPKCAPKSA